MHVEKRLGVVPVDVKTWYGRMTNDTRGDDSLFVVVVVVVVVVFSWWWLSSSYSRGGGCRRWYP